MSNYKLCSDCKWYRKAEGDQASCRRTAIVNPDSGIRCWARRLDSKQSLLSRLLFGADRDGHCGIDAKQWEPVEDAKPVAQITRSHTGDFVFECNDVLRLNKIPAGETRDLYFGAAIQEQKK